MADNSSLLSSGSPVSLGGISLVQSASPSSIKYGSRQQIKVHKVIGGKRYFQVLGNDPEPITFNAAFWGPDAETSGAALMALADGTAKTLVWGTNNIDVLVEAVPVEDDSAEFRYNVTCHILNVVTASTYTTSAQTASTALTSAAAVPLTTNTSSLSAPISTAQTALVGQSDASVATTQLQAVQTQAQTAVATASGVPLNPAGSTVASYAASLVAASQAASDGVAAQSVLNLSTVALSAATI